MSSSKDESLKSSTSDNDTTTSTGTWMGSLRAAREWAYPTRQQSAFLSKGVLTPEEFVRAGDELVFRCPTWSWESGDPKKSRSYLPSDKQYLVTRNVPCTHRVASMEQELDLRPPERDDNDTNSLDGGGIADDQDWLVSHVPKVADPKKLEDEFDFIDETGEVVAPPLQTSAQGENAVEKPANSNTGATEEDEEYADMANFEDEDVLQDDVAALAIDDPEADHILKVRTYCISITYDKYYQTPRVWLRGNSETGQPLTGPEMMEDVMTDYAHKTVTIEAHPHVAGPHASIHPCQHGKVMKTIVRNLIRAAEDQDTTSAQGPSVEMYLFIFLKFVSSIIPTISYDFTMDVAADTRRK